MRRRAGAGWGMVFVGWAAGERESVCVLQAMSGLHRQSPRFGSLPASAGLRLIPQVGYISHYWYP
jgi:hypothetical protein